MSSHSPEYSDVELPFIEQLTGMGWEFLPGDTNVPYLTERESFRDVLLAGRVRKALRRINLDDDGHEWLDSARVNQALGDLQRLGPGGHGLLEANQRATDRLLTGTTVEGDPDRHGGREQVVRYIDFDRPERNDFLVINQFRVDPPWAVGDRDAVIPDLVLFVNGIPLVVVECKSSAITDPIDAAITQLLRYSSMRDWVDEPEGAERLFWHNQLMVATSFDDARIGTVGASYPHYIQWKDTSPVPQAQVAAELGLPPDRPLSSQQTLVAGALRPAHLLDLVRNFTLFAQSSGRTVKIAARYQQYRAVQQSIDRLLTGRTRREDGEHDRRGGIVWHTQGSGKSLTMVFLVRKMRAIPELRRFKVVVVTDRRDLQRQLSDTAKLTGENVRVARNARQLEAILREDAPDLVFAMIQKYQSGEGEAAEPHPLTPSTERRGGTEPTRLAAEDPTPYDPSDPLPPLPLGEGGRGGGVLNPSEHILVLVDEAHRSHTKTMHANLQESLPNCAMIGFTGTPILIGDQKRTHDIFGDFIDRYTILQSERDGVTLPILYEGREVLSYLKDGRTIDDLFEEWFAHLSPEDRRRLQQEYVTRSAILETPQLIALKARDMLRHYVDTVLPEGFKAQVVASSRAAAVLYQQELTAARDELVEQIEHASPDDEFAQRAARHLPTIRLLEFAAIISGIHNELPLLKPWTDSARQTAQIERFKRPLTHPDPAKQDGLAFLCVKSMLLTGFDAPVEQVLYLDRMMQGHELLQAIARVNRARDGKLHGLVVDYYGIADRLEEALAVYRSEDVQGALASIKDELPKLADRHRRVLAIFHERGIPDIADEVACVYLLRDTSIRAEFVVKFKQFLDSLSVVLPRPEALPFVPDARRLGDINQRARTLYRDEQMNLRAEGHKVRQLIDDHLIAQGIDPKVPPMSITAVEFEQYVAAQGSSRAAASEMEHAARHHISVHFNEDPVRYARLSERIEDILKQFADNWDQLAIELGAVVRDVRSGRVKDPFGLDPNTEAPFRDLLAEELAVDGDAATLASLSEHTVPLVAHIRQEVRLVDFWRSLVAQNRLRGWIVQYLDDNDLAPFDRQQAIADRLVQLAKQRHGWLSQ